MAVEPKRVLVHSSENGTELEFDYDSGTIGREEKLFPARTSICRDQSDDRVRTITRCALAANLACRQSSDRFRSGIELELELVLGSFSDLTGACCEMSRRDGAIVAWHEVPGTGPPQKSRPVGYGVIGAGVRTDSMIGDEHSPYRDEKYLWY